MLRGSGEAGCSLVPAAQLQLRTVALGAGLPAPRWQMSNTKITHMLLISIFQAHCCLLADQKQAFC